MDKYTRLYLDTTLDHAEELDKEVQLICECVLRISSSTLPLKTNVTKRSHRFFNDKQLRQLCKTSRDSWSVWRRAGRPENWPLVENKNIDKKMCVWSWTTSKHKRIVILQKLSTKGSGPEIKNVSNFLSNHQVGRGCLLTAMLCRVLLRSPPNGLHIWNNLALHRFRKTKYSKNSSQRYILPVWFTVCKPRRNFTRTPNLHAVALFSSYGLKDLQLHHQPWNHSSLPSEGDHCPYLQREGQKSIADYKLQRHFSHLCHWQAIRVYPSSENDPNPEWKRYTPWPLYANSFSERHILCRSNWSCSGSGQRLHSRGLHNLSMLLWPWEGLWFGGVCVLLHHLYKSGINGKAWRIIRSFYCDPTAQVRIGNELSKVIRLKRGVRQGSVLSPMLFLLVMDSLVVTLTKAQAGVSIRGINTGSLCHADDLRGVTPSLSSNFFIRLRCRHSAFKLDLTRWGLLMIGLEHAQQCTNHCTYSCTPGGCGCECAPPSPPIYEYTHALCHCYYTIN